MPLPPFQNDVAQFVSQYDLEIPVADRMLDLTSEIGELAKEILASTHYGRQDFCANEAWISELGDVLFSLICLANTTNVNMVDALTSTLAKYQTRLADRGDAGSN